MQGHSGRMGVSPTGDGGFRVKIYLDTERLEVVSNEGEHWAWPLAEVSVMRHGGHRFELSLGDEQVDFAPDEPIRFGAAAVGQVDEDTDRRGWLRRRIEAAREAEADEPIIGDLAYVEDLEPRPSHKDRKRRHEHVWEQATSVGVLRRRCVDCGHISIDATGFVSEFDLAGEPPPDPYEVTPSKDSLRTAV